MKLYLATGNAHKAEELTAILAASGLAVEVLTAKNLGGMPDVDEDQDNFAGNALKKAQALLPLIACDDAWSLADDSGLTVDFLDGAPGVYSARYAGEGASDCDNLNKLMSVLEDVGQREAAFECHLSLLSKDGEYYAFSGKCSGRISEEKRGNDGFGYDPVFVPEGHDRSFAEMSGEEKAELSHRGRALVELVDWLKTRLGDPS
tara:strand:+ start:375 stop:986 length:612 start_codon:yes stop_codon:yes gene_type:complete